MIARSNLIRRAAAVVFAIWSVGSFALHQLAFTEQLRLRGSSTAWRTAGVEDRLTAIATLAVGPFYRSMLAELWLPSLRGVGRFAGAVWVGSDDCSSFVSFMNNNNTRCIPVASVVSGAGTTSGKAVRASKFAFVLGLLEEQRRECCPLQRVLLFVDVDAIATRHLRRWLGVGRDDHSSRSLSIAEGGAGGGAAASIGETASLAVAPGRKLLNEPFNLGIFQVWQNHSEPCLRALEAERKRAARAARKRHGGLNDQHILENVLSSSSSTAACTVRLLPADVQRFAASAADFPSFAFLQRWRPAFVHYTRAERRTRNCNAKEPQQQQQQQQQQSHRRLSQFSRFGSIEEERYQQEQQQQHHQRDDSVAVIRAKTRTPPWWVDFASSALQRTREVAAAIFPFESGDAVNCPPAYATVARDFA
jgi:hypothetical protein